MNPPGAICGLDPARLFGWAVAPAWIVPDWPLSPLEWAARSGPPAGVVYGTRTLGRPARPLGELFARAEDWVLSLIDTYGVCILGVEAPILHNSISGATSIRQQVGLSAIISLAAQRRGIAVYDFERSTICKAVAGNGAADKPQVQALYRGRGWPTEDTNASDALAVLDYTVLRYRTPRQKEAAE